MESFLEMFWKTNNFDAVSEKGDNFLESGHNYISKNLRLSFFKNENEILCSSFDVVLATETSAADIRASTKECKLSTWLDTTRDKGGNIHLVVL